MCVAFSGSVLHRHRSIAEAGICCNLCVEYLKQRVVKPITMNKFLYVWLSAGLVIGQLAYTAEGDCKPLPDVEGDVLVALVSAQMRMRCCKLILQTMRSVPLRADHRISTALLP